MNRIMPLLFALVFLLLSIHVVGQTKPLRLYSIDVEGGQSTLIVSPSGQSLLIDTGWPGFDNRDADRIVSAATEAGVSRIDYLLITHYHRDHVGGVPQLAAKMPIGTFIDHGPNLEDSDVTRQDYAAYEKVLAGHKRVVAKPGDHLPIKGLDLLVLSAAGNVIGKSLPGAGQPNPACASEPKPTADKTENARSLGVLITYGKFRLLDLGDLTKDKELELVCPDNKIGKIDLFIVSHHGWSQSNTKALVSAIAPAAAIMNNGAHKGGTPETWQVVNAVVNPPSRLWVPGLWQLHYAVDGGPQNNVDGKFIANPDERNDTGYSIQVEALPTGTFTIQNGRNDQQQSYNVPVDTMKPSAGK